MPTFYKPNVLDSFILYGSLSLSFVGLCFLFYCTLLTGVLYSSILFVIMGPVATFLGVALLLWGVWFSSEFNNPFYLRFGILVTLSAIVLSFVGLFLMSGYSLSALFVAGPAMALIFSVIAFVVHLYFIYSNKNIKKYDNFFEENHNLDININNWKNITSGLNDSFVPSNIFEVQSPPKSPVVPETSKSSPHSDSGSDNSNMSEVDLESSPLTTITNDSKFSDGSPGKDSVMETPRSPLLEAGPPQDLDNDHEKNSDTPFSSPDVSSQSPIQPRALFSSHVWDTLSPSPLPLTDLKKCSLGLIKKINGMMGGHGEEITKDNKIIKFIKAFKFLKKDEEEQKEFDIFKEKAMGLFSNVEFKTSDGVSTDMKATFLASPPESIDEPQSKIKRIFLASPSSPETENSYSPEDALSDIHQLCNGANVSADAQEEFRTFKGACKLAFHSDEQLSNEAIKAEITASPVFSEDGDGCKELSKKDDLNAAILASPALSDTSPKPNLLSSECDGNNPAFLVSPTFSSPT